MDSFQIAAALLTLAAIFSYLNHRWLKLPTTIGLMLIAMASSLALVALGEIFPAVEATREGAPRRHRLQQDGDAGDAGVPAVRGARCTSTSPSSRSSG